MLLGFKCYDCGAELEADASRAGADVPCPQCGEECRVPSRTVRAGVTIGGFHVERQLGVGGMGEVYLATQLSMDREVALKILPETMTRKPDAVERFLQEVRMAAKVNHPHIVTAFEAGEDDGIYHLAMQFVDGRTLGDVLRDDGPMHEGEALRLIDQLASALEYAWDKHALMHRDIKPANIMIDEAGDAHLMDMGLSKTFGENHGITVTGEIMGSPNYMSPEQAEGLPVDTRTDMFSLGATFYHMLSGEIPYYGATIMETMRRLAVEDIADPRVLRPDLSPESVSVMLRMADRDPNLRYGSWAELRRDLTAAKEGRPISPRPSASRRATHSGGQGKDPGRWIWIGLVAAVPVFMLVVVGILIAARPEVEKPGSDVPLIVHPNPEPLVAPNLQVVDQHLRELRAMVQAAPNDKEAVILRMTDLRGEIPIDDWLYLRGKLAKELGVELVPERLKGPVAQKLKERQKFSRPPSGNGSSKPERRSPGLRPKPVPESR